MLATDLKQALDPVIFSRETLNFNPDEWQETALRWTGKKLLLNCCRQSGKSTTAAVLALHRAIFYPDSLILLVSPSLRQSSELFRKVEEEFSKLNVKPELKEHNRLSMAFKDGSRIISLPSKEANIRGYSNAALIIEDEAARVSDELYYAVRPMLAVSGGKIILMSTPFGKRGHFFHEWQEGEGWERIKITAYNCPRISEEFLEEERKAMPDLFFRAEYMGEFTETIDSVFSYEQVMEAITEEVEPLTFGGEK